MGWWVSGTTANHTFPQDHNGRGLASKRHCEDGWVFETSGGCGRRGVVWVGELGLELPKTSPTEESNVGWCTDQAGHSKARRQPNGHGPSTKHLQGDKPGPDKPAINQTTGASPLHNKQECCMPGGRGSKIFGVVIWHSNLETEISWCSWCKIIPSSPAEPPYHAKNEFSWR